MIVWETNEGALEGSFLDGVGTTVAINGSMRSKPPHFVLLENNRDGSIYLKREQARTLGELLIRYADTGEIGP